MRSSTNRERNLGPAIVATLGLMLVHCSGDDQPPLPYGVTPPDSSSTAANRPNPPSPSNSSAPGNSPATGDSPAPSNTATTPPTSAPFITGDWSGQVFEEARNVLYAVTISLTSSGYPTFECWEGAVELTRVNQSFSCSVRVFSGGSYELQDTDVVVRKLDRGPGRLAYDLEVTSGGGIDITLSGTRTSLATTELFRYSLVQSGSQVRYELRDDVFAMIESGTLTRL